MNPCIAPIPPLERCVGDSNRSLRGLEIDPGFLGEMELNGFAAGERIPAQGAPQMGELGAQGRGGIDWRLVGPNRGNELVSRYGTATVEDQISKQDTPLAAPQGRRNVASAHIRLEASAKLYPGRSLVLGDRGCKRFRNAVFTKGQHEYCIIDTHARQLDSRYSRKSAGYSMRMRHNCDCRK